MLRDGTKIAQTGEHKQMPSNDLQMQICIRNTYAHTMRDPRVEKKKNKMIKAIAVFFLKLNISIGI